ncbi:MAG: molybdenum cofactor biosynthesis protein B [Halobacteriota archaeon]
MAESPVRNAIYALMQSTCMRRQRSQAHHKPAVNKRFEVGVISISTSRFAKYGSVKAPEEAEDISGRIIIDFLRSAGHKVRSYTLISDEAALITASVRALLSNTDVIITTGGTGLAPRDVTIEAVQQMLQKEIPGFGELFRSISYDEIGSAAMLTRATSGIIGNTAIFCLPGSPDAVTLAMEALIVPELQHILLHASEQ